MAKFSKVAGYKMNIEKSSAFLHTNNKLSGRENKKTISSTIASENKMLMNKFNQRCEIPTLRKLQGTEKRN